jgi:hypothetical protein
MLAGSTPMLILVACFRRFIGIAPDHHVGGRAASTLVNLALDSTRWKDLATSVIEHGYKFGGLWFSGAVALLLYIACVGFEGRDLRYAIRMSFGTLLGTFLGFCLVIVIGPFDIAWQVATALERLMLQLWPAAIFLGFLSARTLQPPAV